MTHPLVRAAGPIACEGSPTTLRHVQARRLRVHAMACCAWLLLFTLAGFGVLGVAGIALPTPFIVLGALAPLLGLALLASPVQPARRYTLNMLAATLFLPIGLLFAVASLDLEPAAKPTAVTLDPDRLFAGATLAEEVALAGGSALWARQGRFADGSELRLLRFAGAEAAARHLAMLSAALHGEPFDEHGRRGVRLRQGVLPDALLLLEQHGPDLLELRAHDVAGGLARLALQRVPAPRGVVAHAPAWPHWPFVVVAALAHAVAFVGLIVWGGRWTTRVPAATGVARVNAAVLRARLEALAADPHAPFTVAAEDGRLVVEVAAGEQRSHRIALTLDDARTEVRVTERVGAHGARPRDADEARLRVVGDACFDPTRPQADRVWQTTWQATLIDPERLAAVPLRPLGLHAELPCAYARALDGEGVLTVLCALVTRSGWHWQPRLGAA